MTTAIVDVHWKNGFFVTNGGLEFALLMATAAATVSLAGPGAYSVDGYFPVLEGGLAVGLGGIALGLLMALVVAFIRTVTEHAETHEGHTTG